MLDELLTEDGEEEGFEGNAQSFRVVTKLALISPEYNGLRLTRTTLAGMLKYPWPRDLAKKAGHQKFGYYRSELPYFDHASELLPKVGEGNQRYGQGLEAQIMDLSDDITYSVHDLEELSSSGVDPVASDYESACDERDGFPTEADRPR